MLREIRSQRTDEQGQRRWFQGAAMDLFVWQAKNGRIVRFQLAYDTTVNEKILSWAAAEGYRHASVDDGSRPGHHPASPVLLAGGVFPLERVRAAFLAEAGDIDAGVTRFVLDRLAEYPHAVVDVRDGGIEAATAGAARPQARAALAAAAFVLLAAVAALLWQAFGGP